MAQEIVVNTVYGGFNLSQKALELLPEDRWYYDDRRSDPELLRIVGDLGEEANGPYSSLAIVKIPDGVDWCIEDYDGREWIAEKHRIWGNSPYNNNQE